jgi:hypothetical protein
MANADSVFSGLRAWLAAAAVVLMAAGCGGGGGGETGTPATGGTTITDSFGQPVAAGDGGIGDGDSGADGTAGEGAPIVGGTILITDATGKTVSATTNAQGYYRAKVTGFTPPFVAKVTTPSGKVFHSLTTRSIVRNGFITLNLSGLTEKIAFDVAKAGGQSRASQLTPAIVASNQIAIGNAIQSLRTQLAAQIAAAGVDVNTFDPIGVPFKADHTGYDKVLDTVSVTINTDGTVAVAPTPGAGGGTTLAGNWNFSVTTTAEGQTHSFDAGVVPASAVPSQEIASANLAQSAVQQFVAQYSGYTVTSSGNTITVVGQGTNMTITINSISVTNYTGCGSSCGVGAVVQYTVNMNITISGTESGHTIPPTSSSGNTTFRYVRAN